MVLYIERQSLYSQVVVNNSNEVGAILSMPDQRRRRLLSAR